MNGLFSIDCGTGRYGYCNKRIRTLEVVMLTRITTAALAITLLGASAFALAPLDTAGSAITAVEPLGGTTVIEKNSAWPLKSRMSMDPCAVTTCQEA